MSKIDGQPVVIVGAGITGLTLAQLLTSQGIPTVVVEKLDRPGGLARSFKYDGYTFDIGPHRFHTDAPRVDSFIRDTLGPDTRTISRESCVRFEGQFYPWPLHPSFVLLKFPPRIAFGVLRDLFFLFRKQPAVSFRDQIVNMYGPTLYHNFFEGYSSKFLGIVPELTHSDWAKTGIDRAIIDKRLEMSSLWQLILSSLLPKKTEPIEFLYPAGGCGRFTDLLAESFQANGGELLCGSEVTDIEVQGDQITRIGIGDREIEPQTVVWTGTIHSLLDLLEKPRAELNYLALVCYNVMMSEGSRPKFQWCYHGASDVIFSRLSTPENFDLGNVPQGKRGLCVEVTCNQDDSVYTQPEKHLDRVFNDLKREGLLKTDHEIVDVKAERHPWAYPIYRLDYKSEMKAVREEISGIKNLIRAGRLGRFWYNNMDHCIENAFALAERIIRRSRPDGDG
jgi:protoporphyrinogen oxidase